MSLESLQAHGQAPVGGVAFREPTSGITQKLPIIEFKGKGIATDEQVAQSLLELQTPKKKSTTDQYIFQRRILVTEEAPTRPSTQLEDDTSANIVRDTLSPTNAETGADTDKTNSESDTEKLNIGEEQEEDVAGKVDLEEKTAEVDEVPGLSITWDKIVQGLSSRVFTLELCDLPHKINQIVNEVIKEAVQMALQALLPLEASMECDNKDKFLAEKDKSRKRRHDEQDPPSPPPDSDQSKKKRYDSDTSGLKQPPVPQSSALKTSDTKEAPSSFSKQKFVPHSEQPAEEVPIPDDVNISDSEDTNTAHLPKIKTRPDWLNPVPEEDRPETPKPDWFIPSNDLPESENNWANAFSNSKSKLSKASLEGPAYKIDMVNPEGKPLPLGGPPGQVTIQPQLFFNKDLEYLVSGSQERRNALSISKLKAAYYPDFRLEEIIPSFFPSDRGVVRSHMRILNVISLKTYKSYGYTFLKEIILRRANYNEYKVAFRHFRDAFSVVFGLSVTQDTVMSDSEDSTVTYTAVSSPFVDLPDIGSPGVDGPPVMPEDPYAYVVAAFQAPPSPDYVSGPESRLKVVTMVKELENVSLPLVDDLEALKDSSTELLMVTLTLEGKGGFHVSYSWDHEILFNDALVASDKRKNGALMSLVASGPTATTVGSQSGYLAPTDSTSTVDVSAVINLASSSFMTMALVLAIDQVVNSSAPTVVVSDYQVSDLQITRDDVHNDNDMFDPSVLDKPKDHQASNPYVVPTGRVKVPAGRYVVPTGKDNVIVSAGRSKVIPADDAKDIWLAVKARFGGNDESKKIAKSMMKLEFRNLGTLEIDLKGVLSYDQEVLCSLPKFTFIIATTLDSKDVIMRFTKSNQRSNTFTTDYSSSVDTSSNVIENVLHSFVAESDPQQQITYEDFDQIGKLDLEELDIKWQMAMLSVRINRFEKKAGRKMKFNNKDAARFDKKKVKCYKCSELGHFARECTGKQLDSKARYSSFKLKELDKSEEPKALLSVDSMLNWSDHEGEDVENGAAQVYGMIAGAEEDAAGSATGDATGDVADDVSNAAAEFALMGISSQVHTCPFGCEHLYAELKKEFDNVEVQYKECYIQVQAYKSTLQTLEQQKGWYQSNQLALEERIRILTANLENTTNMLKYTEKLNEQAKLEKLNDKVKLEESKARFDKWKDSSKNLDKLINSSMSSRSKFGLGFGDTFGSDEVFDLSAPSIFDSSPYISCVIDLRKKPLHDRFVKTVGMHAVPPLLTGTFMPPSNNPDLDDTQFTYGSKSNNYSESNSVSNDFVSCNNSDKSSDSETTDFASCVSSVKSSSSKTNEPLASVPSSVDFKTMTETADQQPSSTKDNPIFSFKENIKPPRNLCNKSGVNNKSLCNRKSFGSKTCFVCGSKFHLIKDCEFYEKQLELNNKPMWTNVANIPSFVPKAASVPAGSRNRTTSVPAGSRNRPTSVPAGWKNHVARPMTRPSSHYFQHFSRPGYYNHMYMNEGRWGTAENPHKNRDLGIVDSGCSRSMTGNKEKLDDFVKIVGGTVTFGGGDGKITGKGTIRTSKLNFENVYYAEELQNFNLFFVSQICDTKNKVLFTDKECLVLSKEFQLPENSQVVLRIPRRHNLYCFNLSDIQPERDVTCLLAKASLEESTKWHRRMAHVNFKNMNKLAKHGLVNGLPSKLFTNEHNCVACNKGKQHKASYKAITAVSTISAPLQLLHMDLFGPTSIRSIDHKYYSLVVTDDFSRFTWVFFLGTKDETYGILKDFITFIENQLTKKVKAIRCDNGTEFKNSKLIELCGSKGIRRDYSNARTPQQNGVAERKNRTLIEAARTMLADSMLPTMFWTEAVSTACYVLNRVLLTKPHNKTPYELVSGKVPNISHLKPFGCLVTILNTSDHLGKFEGKTDEGFIVGYAAHSKAYRVYNLSSKKIEETLNLRYLEDKPNVPKILTYMQVIRLMIASDMVESSSDYVEELDRLQNQAYEANAIAEKHLSQADLHSQHITEEVIDKTLIIKKIPVDIILVSGLCGMTLFLGSTNKDLCDDFECKKQTICGLTSSSEAEDVAAANWCGQRCMMVVVEDLPIAEVYFTVWTSWLTPVKADDLLHKQILHLNGGSLSDPNIAPSLRPHESTQVPPEGYNLRRSEGTLNNTNALSSLDVHLVARRSEYQESELNALKLAVLGIREEEAEHDGFLYLSWLRPAASAVPTGRVKKLHRRMVGKKSRLSWKRERRDAGNDNKMCPDVTEDNFAERMVALIAKRRREFACTNGLAGQRNKPLTYAQTDGLYENSYLLPEDDTKRFNLHDVV
ncbi:putative ribonuclease H-like domain-containing protein [Tanacetum coccineum]